MTSRQGYQGFLEVNWDSRHGDRQLDQYTFLWKFSAVLLVGHFGTGRLQGNWIKCLWSEVGCTGEAELALGGETGSLSKKNVSTQLAFFSPSPG